MRNNCSFIYETCSCCGKNLFKTKDIFITKDSDRYICKKCKEIHNINAVKCADLEN